MSVTTEYPAALGSFLRENYSYQFNSGVKRTPLNNGKVRQRRVAGQLTKISVSQKLTVSQMDVFESFHADHGWDWFLVNIETGAGFRQAECRIIDGAVTASLVDSVGAGENLYQLSFVMEVR